MYRPMYMNIPPEFVIPDHPEYNNKDHALEVLQCIYGQKQSRRVWNKYLVRRLKSIGFTQSKYDPCLFYRGKVIYLIYTDDSILAAPTKSLIDECISDIRQTGLEVTDGGDLNNFLGVHIKKLPNGTIKMSQPTLEKQILKDLRYDNDEVKGSSTPARTTILKRHRESEDFDESFNYRSVIGKTGYLEKATRMDLA